MANVNMANVNILLNSLPNSGVYKAQALNKSIRKRNISGSFFNFIGIIILGLIIVVLIILIIIFAVNKNWVELGVSCGLFVICAIAVFIGRKYNRGPFYFIAASAVAADVNAADAVANDNDVGYADADDGYADADDGVNADDGDVTD
jgi:uncharacterized protein YacL